MAVARLAAVFSASASTLSRVSAAVSTPEYSSLGAVISVTEITRRGMELSASIFRPLEIFTFIAFVYFAICWPLAMGIRYWERRLSNR